MRKHLVVAGFDEIVSNKYLVCIDSAIRQGAIDSYSVIDLERERATIEARVSSLQLKPESIYFIPDHALAFDPSARAFFTPILEDLRNRKQDIKVYVAAELKAHEGYLLYCLQNKVSSLVEKPIFAPLKNGIFEPKLFRSIKEKILSHVNGQESIHSVMTLSRYHKIYNDIAIATVKQKMIKYNAPLTSFHFRTAGGVWNLLDEYDTREDHPYKYGYGMLMHGGYHYVDLTTQFLLLNKLIFPDHDFSLTVISFSAHPKDQPIRLSEKVCRIFDDVRPNWINSNTKRNFYGETDIVSIFAMKEEQTGQILTLGTLSLEQTTPSIRSWKVFPDGEYNKNGRISSVDFEAQLGNLFSLNVQCFDVPKRTGGSLDKIDAFARVRTRGNASLFPEELDNMESTFDGLFHSDSNRDLMTHWLLNKEHRSRLQDHTPVMDLTELLALSVQSPGRPFTAAFN